MNEQGGPRGSAFFVLALLSVAVIVYGSLYPFDFHERRLPNGVLGVFIASLHDRPHRGDVIANVLLYMPLGFFGVLAFPQRLNRVLSLLLIFIIGTVLSAGIET